MFTSIFKNIAVVVALALIVWLVLQVTSFCKFVFCLMVSLSANFNFSVVMYIEGSDLRLKFFFPRNVFDAMYAMSPIDFHVSHIFD